MGRGSGNEGGTILYASLRNSSRVSERLRGEGFSLELCLRRRESRRGVRSVIITVVDGRREISNGIKASSRSCAK